MTSLLPNGRSLSTTLMTLPLAIASISYAQYELQNFGCGGPFDTTSTCSFLPQGICPSGFPYLAVWSCGANCCVECRATPVGGGSCNVPDGSCGYGGGVPPTPGYPTGDFCTVQLPECWVWTCISDAEAGFPIGSEIEFAANRLSTCSQQEEVVWWICAGPNLIQVISTSGDTLRARITGTGELAVTAYLPVVGDYAIERRIVVGASGPEPCFGDLNDDQVVDGADLAIVLNAWGPCSIQPCTADLDGSGSVDGADLALVLNAWGPCD